MGESHRGGLGELPSYHLRPCVFVVPRHSCPAELAILMLLAKLSAPRSLRPDLELLFKDDKSRLSRFIDRALMHVFKTFAYTLTFQKRRLRREVPIYAVAIAQYMGASTSRQRAWGFIDGTFRYCARPSHEYVHSASMLYRHCSPTSNFPFAMLSLQPARSLQRPLRGPRFQVPMYPLPVRAAGRRVGTLPRPYWRRQDGEALTAQ
jgi:hypothetical protein